MLILLIPYQLVFPLMAVGILAGIFLKGRGKALREGPSEIRQRLGLLTADEIAKLRGAAPADRTILWFHAASVGEVGALTLLLKKIKNLGDAPRVIVTTSTAAGRDRARDLEGVDLGVLAPMDFYPALRAFLHRAEPSALVLVETELWPATLYLAQRWKKKIAIINGRINLRSFSRYQSIANFVSIFLRGITCAGAQTQEDADRFAGLGVPLDHIIVTGNLKYDLPPAGAGQDSEVSKVLATLGWGEELFVAGSTHPGTESEIIIDAFQSLRAKHPNLRLVLGPRHIERLEETERIIREKGVSFARLSELLTTGRSSESIECLILDSLGYLTAFYSRAIAAFVGGTLAPVGGHNLLEPAIASKPVLFGPHTQSIGDVARALESTGGGFRISDAASIQRILDDLLSNPARRAEAAKLANATANQFTGATLRTNQLLIAHGIVPLK